MAHSLLWAISKLLGKEGQSVKALNAIKAVLDKILGILGTISLTVMTILVVYQVVVRYFFRSPSSVAGPVSQYLFVWMIMFGSAYVYGSHEHLTIDLLKDKFSPKMYMIAEILANICLFAFILLVCVYGGWKYTATQVAQVDPTLHISKAVLYISVPFTGIITLYYAIYNIVQAVQNYKQGSHPHGDELSGTM